MEGTLTVGLMLLALILAGLLRSHRRLQRRLEDLETALARQRQRSSGATADPATPVAEAENDDLVSLVGTTPEGVPTEVDLASDGPWLVAFLSTSCGICTTVWSNLAKG